jgi:hypothetical protein
MGYVIINVMDFDFDDFFKDIKPPPRPPLFLLTGKQMIQALNQSLPTVNTVYRIERNGLGPYTENPGWQKDSHTPRTGRCTPISDCGFKRAFIFLEPDERVRGDWFHHLQKTTDQEYLFGFSSMKQLLRWFHNHEELKELFSRGYKIVVYRNVKGFDSGTQVIFSK